MPVSKLQEHIADIHECGGAHFKMRLADSLYALKDSDMAGYLTVGTACSGSEAPVKVLNELSMHWKNHCDTNLEVVHLFSAEVDPRVQEFIQEHHCPQCLVADICDLRKDRVDDVLRANCTDKTSAVRAVDIFIWGSECDNFSGLNVSTRDPGCYSRNEKKSGRTCRAGMEYVEKHRPYIAVLENVKNMDAGQKKDSDCSKVMADFNRLGYLVHKGIYDPQDCGVPQSRKRIYIIAFLLSAAPIDQTAVGFEVPPNMDALAVFLQIVSHSGRRREIDEFMIQRGDDPELLAWREERMANKNKKQKKEMEYETDHKEAFDTQGFPWPPSKEDFEECDLVSAVEHLPVRAAECVYYHQRNISLTGHDWIAEKETIVDLNMSLKWQVVNYNGWAAPCLVSSSRPYFFRAKRDMCGLEAMALQGWEFHDINQASDFGRFSDSSLIKLAGNAMNCFVLAYILLGAITFMDWERGWAARQALMGVGLEAEMSPGDEESGADESEDGEVEDGDCDECEESEEDDLASDSADNLSS